MKLTEEQTDALNQIKNWYKNQTKKFFVLGGYAGTGKTTMLKFIAEFLSVENKKIRIAFCAYTGKATRVLETKLQDLVLKNQSISTVHSLIYSPILDKDNQVIGWNKKTDLTLDLIILDEASMIGEKTWSDIRELNIPVLCVGDHGQLPPIEGGTFLMKDPDFKLTKVLRQAEKNPIIKLSEMARTNGKIDFGKYGSNVKKIKKFDIDSLDLITDTFQKFDENMLVLCGYNTTRIKLNKYIRQIKQIDTDAPTAGDYVVCLKNDYQNNLFNGMTGKIERISEEELVYIVQIRLFDGGIYKGPISKDGFNFSSTNGSSQLFSKYPLFDFGYALTVHKAQGSQSSNVVLFEERFPQMSDENWRRWLYTGITRAVDSLLIVAN